MSAACFADALPMLAEGRVAIEGNCSDPICSARIQESRAHPGYYDIRVHAGGFASETKRPVRQDFIVLQLEALLRNDTSLSASDLQWRTARRAEVARGTDGYVYFIADEDGFIKIGHASNVDGRLRTLQTASRQALRVITSTPGSVADEKALHAKFSSARVRGEWFAPSADLVGYIKEVSS